MKKDNTKEEIAVVDEAPKNELSALPEVDFGADAGAGLENVTAADQIIPRLTLLNGSSNACTKGHADYIKGAEPGDYMDNITKEVFNGEEGIFLVPVKFRLTHIEWTTGNKFVADLGTDKSIMSGLTRNDKGKYINGEGNIIQPTYEFFVMRYDKTTKDYKPYVISMSSTQTVKARKWIALIVNQKHTMPNGRKVTCPIWYSLFKFTSVPESNDNNTWMGFKIELDTHLKDLGENWEFFYNDCKELSESVTRGDHKAQEQNQEVTGNEASDDAAM